MATCLQVPMMVPSTLRSSSTNSSSSSFDMNPKIGWRNVVSKRRLNCRCSSSNIDLPPIDLNDPFIARFAAHVQANPECSPNSQYPPFLDLFQNPTKSSSSSSSGGRGGSSGGRDSHVVQAARRRGTGRLYGHGIHKTRRPPPDLASKLFEERIVFLGLPMVDLVTELIIAQFVYLQWVDDTAPIYLYLNCTGTTTDENQVVGNDGNALAIYDIMATGKNPIETVCIGACSGYACLLLAAGTFGRRAMFPFCRIAMRAPPVPATGLMPASTVSALAREAQLYRDEMFKLFAYHTGHRLVEIKEKMKHTWYMGAKEALEYGVIDKLIWKGQEGENHDFLGLTTEQWDKLYSGKAIYEP